MNKRKAYRPDQSFALDRIERRRVALGVSHADLYKAADMAPATYFRIRAANKAFHRHIIALRFALRTIEQRRRMTANMFEVIGG
jgi:hypothetical protein